LAVTNGPEVPTFDPSAPSPARIWNYWVGGKDNFASDRAAAEQILAALPSVPLVAKLTRLFLVRVVHELAADHGIRQFLDIGSGLPTADNTHEVAQRAGPSSRIVYVDNDPVVISHANALLVSTPDGRCDYIHADLRDVDEILARAAKTLDFTRPVAVIMAQVLHFIPDSDDPHGIVRRLMEPLAPGSFLVIAHGPSDQDPEAGAAIERVYQASGMRLRLRSRAEVGQFFDGLELIGPGLASGLEWLQVDPDGLPAGASYGHSAVARKP
jgi:O-methyltransferase involved in polyketide biosynthesis